MPRRVPPFFSNLLSEGHLREYLAKLADVNPEREFFLLAVLGADLPGALVIAPLEGDAKEDDAHHDDADAGHDDGRLREAVLRFSLAGVLWKFSAVMQASGVLTVPAGGMGGSWIVKLPSARFAAVPENEFAMLELARRAGIVVPDNRLVEVSEIKGLPEEARAPGSKALAVQPFDRVPGGDPVHMEDFAQVFGQFPNDKCHFRSYANIASVLWAEAGEDAIVEFVRRLVFSVVIGNADIHLKNWSLLYPDRGKPVLSPGYDFVALPYIPNDTLALSFVGSRSLSEITPSQMQRFADMPGFPQARCGRSRSRLRSAPLPRGNASKQADLLPKDLRASINEQILAVAATVK